MGKLKVLVVGGGGREHVLCWSLRRSPQVGRVFCAPGNAGIAEVAEIVALAPTDLSGLAEFAQHEQIDLTVVGPEAPLAEGIVDEFLRRKLRIFGPTRAAAQLEGSKAFAKEFLRRHFIPTAPYRIFDRADEALRFAGSSDGPLVVKADGLAAGKGVIICRDAAETKAAVKKIMVERAFGTAGERIVIESFLKGDELSVMAFADGRRVALMVPSRDYKRAQDGDRGPNTGGMGAYAPSRPIDDDVMVEIRETILEPIINGMAEDGTPYSGVLYVGLMMTDSGPRVLEINCRFGDPETQVVLPLLETDIMDVMGACLAGQLIMEPLSWRDEFCTCVVLASRGYPGKYEKGVVIEGKARTANNGTFCFHAGTARDEQRALVTAGGRIMGLCARAATHEGAVAAAYAAVEGIRIKGAHYRTDIGVRSSHALIARRGEARTRRR
ncbi:MAG TPA: phosphoribosylamine--glycine ligase [Acidobacteriota bacterium]|nr:phosphoribosylamine--glycine ligase [Acidobacteriota bacterium]